MAEKEATLHSIKIRCPKTDKLVNIPFDKIDWNGWEADCDCCGGHGGVLVKIRECKCGKPHSIDVDSY